MAVMEMKPSLRITDGTTLKISGTPTKQGSDHIFEKRQQTCREIRKSILLIVCALRGNTEISTQFQVTYFQESCKE
jgi:hypothetical protein